MKMADASPKVGRNGERKRLDQVLDMLAFPDGKWVTIRLLDPEMEEASIKSIGEHWIDIMAGKKGQAKRQVSIPKICLAHNPDTDKKDLGECPYCELEHSSRDSVVYLANVLDRRAQEDMPAKIKVTKNEAKTGLKDRDSESKTPVKVARLPSSVFAKIQEFKELNKHKVNGKTVKFDVNHIDYGSDIEIKYTSKAAGTDKWQVQLSRNTGALSDEELGYLVHNLDMEYVLSEMGRESTKEAKEELKRMHIAGEEEFDEDSEGEDLGSSGKGKRGNSGKGKKESFESDEDEDLDDDDDDDEEPPRRKGKAAKPASKSRKPSRDDDDDEDDDEDEDLDDDDDEDEPPRRSKGKPTSKSRKPSRDDDDDEDDDDDDEDEDLDDDDDEDEPPRRSKGKPTSKSRSSSRDDDDDDLDDDDDEDDDEDEPPRRSKGKPTAKTASKSRKPSRDDDEDDDLDDDEDDEPPRRTKGKASAGNPISKNKGKPTAKRKPAEDDEDDDIPF